MTWQELLNEGEKRLSKKGVPEAKLNATKAKKRL